MPSDLAGTNKTLLDGMGSTTANPKGVTNITQTGGGPTDVTVSTGGSTGAAPGNIVGITGVNPVNYNGCYYVTSVPNPLRFHYRRRTPAPPYVSGGVVGDCATLSGTTLWMDGASVSRMYKDNTFTVPSSANGDLINGMRDRSGNNYDMSSASSQGPVRTDNDQNTLTDFTCNTGFNRLLRKNTFTDFTAVTIYAVATLTADTQGIVECNVNDTVNTGFSIFSNAGSLIGRWSKGSSSVDATLGGLSYPAFDYYTYLWDGATVTVFKHRTASTSLATGVVTQTIDSVVWGTLGSSVFPMVSNARLHELIIYSVAHSPSTMTTIWDYIANKWNV